MRRLLIGALLAVALALGAAAAWQTWQLGRLEAEQRQERIDNANALAAKDSSVLTVRAEGDSLVAVAERLSFQTEVELREAFRDTVDRLALATARLQIAADSLALEVRIARATRDTAGVITATDTIDVRDSLGIAAAATVRIGPTLEAAWIWTLWREPIWLDLALECEGSLAVAQLAGPAGLEIRIDSVAQRPEFCNPVPRRHWSPFRIGLPSVTEAAVAIGAWELLRLAIGAIKKED